MKQAVIVIPIHQSSSNPSEMLAYQQCYKILASDFDIVLIAPHSLNLDNYTQKGVPSRIETFDKSCFDSRQSYNKLMMSKSFYQRFVDYEYMLIYQLDCYIFRNDLALWCNKGYDYIGSPSFISKDTDWKKLDNWTTGNGGFSLRKISSFLKILNSRRNFFSFKDYLILREKLGANRLKSILIGCFKVLGVRNKINCIVKNFNGNEDEFWSKWVYFICPSFRIAPVEESIGFATEQNAPFFFKENNNQLPFGCHAWQKYNLSFWKKYIPTSEKKAIIALSCKKIN